MADLTVLEVTEMWSSIYSHAGPDKAAIKAAGLPTRASRHEDFQAAEDAIISSGLDLTTLVSHVDNATQRQIDVKASLDAGRIPDDLVPVIEDYLDDSGAFNVRRVDLVARDAWVTANAFRIAMDNRDTAYREVFTRAVLDLRLEAIR